MLLVTVEYVAEGTTSNLNLNLRLIEIGLATSASSANYL